MVLEVTSSYTYLVSGFADIVGRRFGSHKIPYNRNKSLIGSIAMVSAGFLASIGYSFSP